MFEIVVVMLESRARVVRRVDVDALHLPGIKRQQRLQRLQVVALNEQVAGARVTGGQVGRFFQQTIGHPGSGVDVGRPRVSQFRVGISFCPLVFLTSSNMSFFIFDNPLLGFFVFV